MTLPPLYLSDVQNLETTIARFWSKVGKSEPDSCWPWTAHTQKSNTGSEYGSIGVKFDGRYHNNFGAHRLSFLLAHGYLRRDLETCHTCDNGICVNPAHLFQGTHLENMQDRQRKGRGRVPYGEAQHLAKLNPGLVRYLRKEHTKGRGYKSLAKELHVSKKAVSMAAKRITWKHVA